MTDRFYWGRAGETYYAVDDGQIIALLYWDGPAAGDEPGWFWLATDRPEKHYSVDAPDLSDGMAEAVSAAVTDIALEAAAKAIISYLTGHGRL